jgi:hypothetical protein
MASSFRPITAKEWQVTSKFIYPTYLSRTTLKPSKLGRKQGDSVVDRKYHFFREDNRKFFEGIPIALRCIVPCHNQPPDRLRFLPLAEWEEGVEL